MGYNKGIQFSVDEKEIIAKAVAMALERGTAVHVIGQKAFQEAGYTWTKEHSTYATMKMEKALKKIGIEVKEAPDA